MRSKNADLLADVFPLTARALAFRGGESFRAMVENGLAGTDKRIAEGKPVTPAFLFATLLWGAVRAQVEREIAQRLRCRRWPGNASAIM